MNASGPAGRPREIARSRGGVAGASQQSARSEAAASIVLDLEVLDAATAGRFAAIALANIERDYPHKLDHVLGDAGDQNCRGMRDATRAACKGVRRQMKRADRTRSTQACVTRALDWYSRDRDAPTTYEPSGTDFLSPALTEAALMQRVLNADAFGSWLAGFLPTFGDGQPVRLFEPVRVDDRRDPQLVHLDGLNLSRAWCLREIAGALAAGDPRIAVARRAAILHLQAGWDGLVSDDFVGAHCLASFAMLALDA